jgi:Na+-driven multidrug efflux pump
MNILESTLRGIKYSLSPSIVSVFTIIVFRVIWVYFAFPYEPFNTANWLMASFPISWGLASIAYTVIFIVAWKKLNKKFSKKEIE